MVGATGTGKTELSLRLADVLAGHEETAEVVNADAMQLYRGMDIGTAKLHPADRRGVKHHLLDVLDVTEESTVAAYQPVARRTVESIQGRGAHAILVGGSGLYVSSVLHDLEFPGRDPLVRARWEAELEEHGAEELARRLALIDPEAARTVDVSNGRRLVRALEVAEVTGRSPRTTLPRTPRPWRPSLVFHVRRDRTELVTALDARVARMWDDGLVDETRLLLERGLAAGPTASRAIGYAQAAGQLSGRLSREEAITETRLLTRRYARRQVSWFRRHREAVDIDANVSDHDLERLLAGRPSSPA